MAAIFTVPTVFRGLAAWQWQLEAHRLKGIAVSPDFALASAVTILLSWWMYYRAMRNAGDSRAWRISLVLADVPPLIVTGHLGGFLSGVNGVV